MEFNSFDMDIQCEEIIPEEYENWLEFLENEEDADWAAELEDEILNVFFDFDYDQWVKDCEETPWHIGEEETKLFG